MTVTIQEIETAIKGKLRGKPNEWPASMARGCAFAIETASKSKAKKPKPWGAIQPVKDPNETYDGLFLRVFGNKMTLWSRAPQCVDELFVPWTDLSPRYWLYPLVGMETVGGDVSAIAAVSPSNQVHAIYKHPEGDLPLFPFQTHPNKYAVRQKIEQIHKHATDRWGADTHLQHAQTDTGYHHDIILLNKLIPWIDFDPIIED